MFTCVCIPVRAQSPYGDSLWTLAGCLEYAMEHNIQLKQTRNTYLSGVEDTKQARAAMFPSLSASTSQSLANYPSSDVTDNNMYTGSYNLNASMTVFQGGSLSTALKQQKVQNEMDLLSVEETANDIRIAIVQAYMQCLYAAEAVKVSQSTAEASKALKWFEITGKDSAQERKPGALSAIFVKTDYRLLRLELDDIMYIEGLKDYVRIWLRDRQEPVLSLMSMKALEEQLPEDRFVRVHRSYIIQPSAMSYIERGRVVFGKVRVPVSDTYRQELQDFLEKHSILLQTK